MVQQPAEARSLGGVEAPQLSRDAVHEPFMFVLKTKILQDSPRRCLKIIKVQNLTLDLESNFEKLRKTRIFGFFSILQFLVSALEIPSRFRFRSGTLDFF